jgi:hypothetical protein
VRTTLKVSRNRRSLMGRSNDSDHLHDRKRSLRRLVDTSSATLSSFRSGSVTSVTSVVRHLILIRSPRDAVSRVFRNWGCGSIRRLTGASPGAIELLSCFSLADSHSSP